MTTYTNGGYCTKCGLWYNAFAPAHICGTVQTYPNTSTSSWYPNNIVLLNKLEEIISLLKDRPKTEGSVQVAETNHKHPIGEKVRLVNGNTKGQWGTVAQHLLNGQYLVENTWLENDPMKNKDDLPTYQVLAEELIRPLATLLTASDLKVGDVVKYIDGVSGYHRSQSGTFTVTAIGAKHVMLSGLDWHGEQIEFSHDPSDLEPAIKE